MEHNRYEKQLSIIVPVYNTAEYLRECLNSVVAQTVESMEIVLVDDGSTDASGSICDEYAARYDNVRVLHIENHGQSYARKTGVTCAKGEYIGFVDSDDWIDVNMYEEMLGYARGNSLDMVCCGLIYEKGGLSIQRCNEAAPGVYDYEAVQKKILPGILAFGTDYARDRKIEPHLVDKLIKKEIIMNVLSEINEHVYWGEDVLSVLKCILHSNRVGILEKSLYHYRIHSASISLKRDVRAIDSYQRLLCDLLDIADQSEELYDQVRYYSVAALRHMLRIGLGVKSEKFWLFPFEDFKKGISIALYGAGSVGSCYHAQVCETGYFKRVELFDSNRISGRVKGPEELHPEDYDKILIAVDNEETMKSIKQSLMERGILENRLYWKKPRWVRDTFRFCF
ncbi:MAG: glycosyltransferase [Lachnospiraceae bacterium]|nr:glycosyltransferase [Lachnospiraceae bacterium]